MRRFALLACALALYVPLAPYARGLLANRAGTRLPHPRH